MTTQDVVYLYAFFHIGNGTLPEEPALQRDYRYGPWVMNTFTACRRMVSHEGWCTYLQYDSKLKVS